MFHKLSQHEFLNPTGYPFINAGISAKVYDASDTSVMMYTVSAFKVDYLRYLGLIVGYHGRVKLHDPYTGTGWKIELAKLRPVTRAEYRHIWNSEAGALSGYALDPDYIEYEMAERYPIHGVMLRYISDHKRYFKRASWGLDIQTDNYLACPITGVIFPTDVIHVSGYGGDLSDEYYDD